MTAAMFSIGAWRRFYAILLAGAASAGLCPAIASARASEQTYAAQHDDEVRLNSVGYRLATANARFCSPPQMMTGLVLHDLSAYPQRYRSAVSADLGLTGGFGIRAIVLGSAAARADLQERDEIIALNGKDMKSFLSDLVSADASYARTERFIELLEDALRKGAIQLTIRRQDAMITVAFTADFGCGGHMALMPEASLNAWSDGRYVGLTTRMMRFAEDDAELAFVIAHEMAHNMLDHDEIEGHGSPLAALGIGNRRIKASELAADAQAVRTMSAAGYDPSAAERLLSRLGKAKWLRLSNTHPSSARRIAAVSAEIAKLAAENAAKAR